MKQFDRLFLEKYRRIPKNNNILYQNYSNPSAEGQYSSMQMQEPAPNPSQSPLQKPPQEVQERWPQDATYRNLLPPSMQGYNSNQILQELQKSYQANQNLTNQRSSFDRDMNSQRHVVDRKGQEELSRLYTLNDYLENYPNTAKDTAVRTTYRLHGKPANATTIGATRTDTSGKGEADLRLILNTPNRSVNEANNILRQKYGNKYTIPYNPEAAKKYGYNP